MASQLATIASGGDQKVKIEQYKTLLQQFLDAKSINDLKAFVDHSSYCCWMVTLT
jgi:hypothetical protein